MEPDNVYASPESAVLSEPEVKAKPSILLIIITTLIVIINAFLSIVVNSVTYAYSGAYGAGFAVGTIIGIILLPLIVVALFQIGRRFRNPRSRLRIFCWTSVVVLLSKLGNMLSAVQAV